MSSVELQARIAATNPLVLQVSLINSLDAAGSVFVPRLLTPLGAFVKVTVVDEAGDVMWASRAPKLALKLHPERLESYVELGRGYSYGITFRLPDLPRSPERCEVRVSYSNGSFTGTRDHPIGALSYEAAISVSGG
jgi:hypothetical protein